MLTFVPADDIAICVRSADASFYILTLPPISCLGENPAASDVYEMVDAEVSHLCNFTPENIYAEWPAPTKNYAHKNTALLAFEGVTLWADSIGRNVECVTTKSISVAFGARKANRESIEAAVRDFGIGWQPEITLQRETIAVAALFTVLARGVAA